MSLRVLFRAARELYLDCQAERLRAEHEAAAADEPAFLQWERFDRAKRRETAMRQASLSLVRYINS